MLKSELVSKGTKMFPFLLDVDGMCESFIVNACIFKLYQLQTKPHHKRNRLQTNALKLYLIAQFQTFKL